MKKTIMKVAAVCLVAGAVLTGCTKEGPVGPAGTNGTNGTNGNANVQVHNVYAVPSNWISDGNGGWYNIVTNNSFGSGLDLTKVSVNVYLSYDNVYWQALPFVASTTGQVNVNYGYTSSTIQVNYDPPVGILSAAQPTANINFKTVLIPAAMIKPNVNVHSYAELKAAYNIN